MQFEMFVELLDRLRETGIEFPMQHAANSGAIMEMPLTHLNMVRAGISIYGLYPSDEVDKTRVKLKPAMQLKTRIVHLKTVPPGFSVSYGMTYKTKEKTVIATIPAGYGDGISRLLSGSGYMLVRGQKAPILGRVCMDLIMLDVGKIPGVKPGDEVVIIGRQQGRAISADDLASLIDTINYEIVTSISERVTRIYLDGSSPV